MVTSSWDTFSTGEKTWALGTFSESGLSDRRPTNRLADIATRLVDRSMTITAFIAVPLLQSQERMEAEEASPPSDTDPSTPLTPEEWRVL